MADHIRPAGIFDTTYEQDIALNRTRTDKFLQYGGLVALLLIPLLTSRSFLGLNILPDYVVVTINTIAIFVIAAQGLNILIGYTGQISLGHAAFMAVGAYSGALLAKGFAIPIGESMLQIGPFSFWIALPLAALFTGLVGLLFGLPSLRVKGFYLAMATLAAQFIIPWIIEHPLQPYTNAPEILQGIPQPTIGPLVFARPIEMYYIIVPLSVLLMLASRNIMRTRVGRAFISIRDNDLAAELLGINVFWYKLQSFFLSSLYAGIAGALIAFERNAITTETFSLETSIALLAMLVIGGAGYPKAALFGVAFVRLLTDVIIPAIGPAFNSTLTALLPFVDGTNIGPSLQPIIFGVALVIFLIFEPRGLAYRWEVLRIAWKIRPFAN